MIKIIHFNFPKTSLACVGKPEAIQDLDTYFALRNAPGKAINIDDFLDRIIMDHVYARFEGKTLFEKLNIFLRGYNKKLKANDLYMTYREFVEASVLTMPDKACIAFQLKDNEIDYIQKHSVWNKRFYEQK